MAKLMPNRTDNDIKNKWNSMERTKETQRAKAHFERQCAKVAAGWARSSPASSITSRVAGNGRSAGAKAHASETPSKGLLASRYQPQSVPSRLQIRSGELHSQYVVASSSTMAMASRRPPYTDPSMLPSQIAELPMRPPPLSKLKRSPSLQVVGPPEEEMMPTSLGSASSSSASSAFRSSERPTLPNVDDIKLTSTFSWEQYLYGEHS